MIMFSDRNRSSGKSGASLLATGVLVSAFALLGAGGAAQAQTAPGDERAAAAGDEIIVTANRREESLQDVPSAIAVLSSADIEQRGIDSFEGFARSIPGLTMNQATKNRASFNIRGISTNTNGLNNTQDPVSVYINDAPVTDTYAAAAQPDLRLFDVDRIEILRGPQGTLFGSGSLGGTIRIITKKPDADNFAATGRVDFGVSKGGALRQRYDAMVNLPLVEDRLALRVVGYYRDEEGWVKNVALNTRNDTVDWGGRVALRWTPTPDVSVKAEVFHQDSDPEEGDNWNPALGKFRKSASISEARPLKLTNYNLSADFDVADFATITASSTFQKGTAASRQDIGPILGAGSPSFLVDAAPWTSRFYIQELRLVSNTNSPLQWVLGAFYANRKTEIPDYLITAPGLDEYFGGALGSDIYFDTDITTKSTELAGYADATLEVANGLKVRGGVRVFHTTADYIETGRIVLNPATQAYSPPLSFANRAKGTHTTWRAGISYEPDTDRLLYANVSKGFRVGQVNANFGPSAIDPSDYVIPEGYDPDTTINYEVGGKATFAGGRVTMNVAAYYIDWKNIQIDGTRLSDLRSFIANAGKATVKGLEFEMTARPARGVNMYASVAVQDGKIESVPTNIVVPAAKGDRLPGLAPWKVSGGIEYRWDLDPRNEAYVRTDAQFTDDAPNTFANGGSGINPLYAINEAYSTVSASAGVDTAWGNVAIYGENITNNNSIILKNLRSLNPFSTLRPRTFGVRLTYRH